MAFVDIISTYFLPEQVFQSLISIIRIAACIASFNVSGEMKIM